MLDKVMKTRKFFMVLVILFMGSQAVVFAQENRPERKRMTREQMQEMQTNQLVKALALDDATAAKFTSVYKNYMDEMRATRDMGSRKKADDKATVDKQAPKPVPTDAEVEAAIKARFAQSRKMLDVREKYYDEFRKFLSPKQIQKMYNQEKNVGDKFRKESDKRKGMHKHDGQKRR